MRVHSPDINSKTSCFPLSLCGSSRYVASVEALATPDAVAGTTSPPQRGATLYIIGACPHSLHDNRINTIDTSTASGL